MLYRFNDCGTYSPCFACPGSDPGIEVWIEANSTTAAIERCADLLALTFQVESEEIHVECPRSELDLEENAVEGKEAGSRRLIATGSSGEYPTYYPSPVLMFVSLRNQRRLLDAFAAAREHAAALAGVFDLKAASAENERQKEQYARQAENYRRFASADLGRQPE